MRQNARIVVEGMDGSGKSTLVRKLLEGFGPEVSYLVRNDRGPDRDLRSFWYDSLGHNPPGSLAIHDRFFYPEIVYGPVLRGRLSVDGGTIDYVSQYLRHFAFLIYCRPPLSVIEEGIKVEDQWPGVRENFNSLVDQYDHIMMTEAPIYGDRFFRYDWTVDDVDVALYEALRKYLEH